MVHNNKVLTVSYGTFSCTLEGFEDSFGTMKAIAEYFRDLASDDRYFGAEPPQPDAEMLARIAQREVARQVEARTSSDGIHLRTAAPKEEVAPAATATALEVPVAEPAPVPTPAPVEPAPADVVALQEVETAETAEETTEDEGFTDFSSIDLFEEASEEAPAEDAPIKALPVAEAEAETKSEAEPSVDMATIAAISAAVSGAPAEATPLADDTAEGEVELFAEAEPVPEAPRGNDTVPAVDSIAAKLQRIRAVVAQTPEEEFSEDEHAESFVEAARSELTQTEEDDSEAASTIDMEADANDEDISRVLDRLDLTGELAGADNAPEETATKEAEAEETATEEEGDALLGAPSDAAVADQDTVQDADSAQEQVSRPKRGMRRLPVVDANVQQAEPEASVAADAAQTAPPEEAESPAEARPTAAPLRARIVKMKRADLEQAMATGNLEEVEEDGVESSLDADDEAELMRELAEVEADLLASNQEDEADPAESVAEAEALAEKEAQEETQAVSAPVAEAPAETRDTAAPSPDSDVSRLMAAAESKLGDPDNATSRETYSHLRAAVAAAEADRSAGDHSAQADEAEAYREDLANVVRPRRPGSNAGAGGGAKAPRPRSGGERPAPLKLVAEQRIDPAPEAASSKPVRPRRISTPVEEPAAQAGTEGSFSDYAQDRGAVELPELLEAAASYLSFVEGRDHFSRPQLMSKVRSVGHADFNRENGLRSFGQLLRDGKIERANNGHFSATDDIGFRPPERAAG